MTDQTTKMTTAEAVDFLNVWGEAELKKATMASEQTTKPVSHERAREAARRLIAGAFNRDDLRLRFSIPARPDEDDDLVLMTYIEQQETNTHAD